MILDATDFTQNTLQLRALNNFQLDLTVKSQDTDDVLFNRKLCLAEPLSSIAPSLSKDGLFLILAKYYSEETNESGKSEAFQSTDKKRKHLMTVTPYHDYNIRDIMTLSGDSESDKNITDLALLKSRCSIRHNCLNGIFSRLLESVRKILGSFFLKSKNVKSKYSSPDSDEWSIYRNLRSQGEPSIPEAFFIRNEKSIFQVILYINRDMNIYIKQNSLGYFIHSSPKKIYLYIVKLINC